MPARPPAPEARPAHPFEGVSEATDRFQRWQLPQREAAQPVELPQSPPFEGKSTYDADFMAKPLPAMPARPPAPEARPAHPFEGVSEAHDRYQQWQLPQREVAPPGAWVP